MKQTYRSMPRQRDENSLQLPINLGGGTIHCCFAEARRDDNKTMAPSPLFLCLLMIRSQNGARPPLRLFLLLRLRWLQHNLYRRIEDTLYVLQFRWEQKWSMLVSLMISHVQQMIEQMAILVGSLSCIRCSMVRLFAFLAPHPICGGKVTMC